MSCAPCYGHAGDFVYPIYEVPTTLLPDLTDGTLADWEESVPAPSLVPSDMVHWTGGDQDLSDLATRVFLAWHAKSQRIYVAVEVLDDRHIGGYEGTGFSDMWRFDSIEFIVDGDHSGGQFAAYDVQALGVDAYARINNSQAQQYTAIAESPDGRTLLYAGAGNGWVTLPPYSDIGTFQEGDEPAHAGYEFYVTPWDDLDGVGPDVSRASRLEGGRIVGFHIVVRDYDEKPGPAGAEDIFYAYSPYRGRFCIACSADESLDGQLVPCDILDCGATPAASAVTGDTWGRIKAAFTVDR